MAYCTGSQVWAYAHGTDERQVEPPKSRKSVGAECNWGIRFQNDADALAFMDNLAGELSTRMKGGFLFFVKPISICTHAHEPGTVCMKIKAEIWSPCLLLD